MFRRLLVQMKAGQLIRQDEDGSTIYLDAAGARIATHYTFPVIFNTPREWQLIAEGHIIGTLPRILPTLPHDLLIFAGRRWQVVAVDATRHILDVKPSKSGVAPDFGGEVAAVHDQVRQRMRLVYISPEVPRFCRGVAGDLLGEARAWFASAGLYDQSLVEDGDDTLLFHWKGDRAAATLKVMLAAKGVRAVEESVCLRIVQSSPVAVARLMATIAAEPPPDAVAMARTVPNKEAEKYDRFLGEELLSLEHAHRVLDVDGAMAIAQSTKRRG
jgi:ATP-dependent Lhr-like helicase